MKKLFFIILVGMVIVIEPVEEMTPEQRIEAALVAIGTTIPESAEKILHHRIAVSLLDFSNDANYEFLIEYAKSITGGDVQQFSELLENRKQKLLAARTATYMFFVGLAASFFVPIIGAKLWDDYSNKLFPLPSAPTSLSQPYHLINDEDWAEGDAWRHTFSFYFCKKEKISQITRYSLFFIYWNLIIHMGLELRAYRRRPIYFYHSITTRTHRES